MKENKKKTITIYVEANPYDWEKDEITYEEVVSLEVQNYHEHPEINYTVKYVKGHGNKPEGVLAPGGTVKVKEGMIFSVTEAGQS